MSYYLDQGANSFYSLQYYLFLDLDFIDLKLRIHSLLLPVIQTNAIYWQLTVEQLLEHYITTEFDRIENAINYRFQ